MKSVLAFFHHFSTCVTIVVMFFLCFLDMDLAFTLVFANVLMCIGSSKKSGKGKRPGKGGNRYWKSIGLGFKTPREAMEGRVFLA